MYTTTAVLAALAVMPTAWSQLNQLAKANGWKYFGSETDNPSQGDVEYIALISNTSEFGQITVGNAQKWALSEPNQNQFVFPPADVIVDMAENNGQLLRCHNLVWEDSLPDWVGLGTWTNETLIAAMKNHITNVVTHFKGKCYCWDVVNEGMFDNGTYRADIFYNTIGPEYIPIAFETAAAADPSAKLYYNEYGIEFPGPKAEAVKNLVRSLQARGIRIDGVGLQAHFTTGQAPTLEVQTANLKSFASLGVEIAYTELDMTITSLPASAAVLAQQAIDYYNTVAACVAAGCVGITMWDYTDKYSWIPSDFPGEGEACPWDANLQKKPAYYGIIKALKENLSVSNAFLLANSSSVASDTVASKTENSTVRNSVPTYLPVHNSSTTTVPNKTPISTSLVAAETTALSKIETPTVLNSAVTTHSALPATTSILAEQSSTPATKSDHRGHHHGSNRHGGSHGNSHDGDHYKGCGS